MKRYGQHGIAKGHGLTTFAPLEFVDLSSRLVSEGVSLIFAILWEPRHARSDVPMVEYLRSLGGDVSTAADRAWVMFQSEEFQRAARAIEGRVSVRLSLQACWTL